MYVAPQSLFIMGHWFAKASPNLGRQIIDIGVIYFSVCRLPGQRSQTYALRER